MFSRAILILSTLTLASCMCWPPIPNASAHSKRKRARYQSPPPLPAPAPPQNRTTFHCQLDLVANVAQCDPRFEVELGYSMGRVAVDVPDGHALIVELEVCSPRGWVLNIGDSATNDGGGGDYGTSSHDAELHLLDTTLEIIANDYAIGSRNRRRVVEDFVWSEGCQPVVFEVRDGEVLAESDAGVHRFSGPTLLRLNPATDAEGRPDNRWFVGINRVVHSARRQGSGVETATLWVVPG